ncbi:MAG: PTS sugar transporter subunit IIC [Deltaproteobacteria bacterium]|nr:PTS sugar transporter subunit IIC [Deltaproteobacteria bacterium]
MSITLLVICIVTGSLLWLDRVFMFQLMISRPIIIASVLGFVLGNFPVGLLVGASIELIWINSAPVGSYLPNDDSFCAIVAVPSAIAASTWMSQSSAAGLALVLSLPTSYLGRYVDMRIRIANQTLIPRDIAQFEHRIASTMYRALARAFFYILIPVGICVMIFYYLTVFTAPKLPAFVTASLEYLPYVCIVIGVAGLFQQSRSKIAQAGSFILGMLAVLLVTWMF